jgi:hypothetical protein
MSPARAGRSYGFTSAPAADTAKVPTAKEIQEEEAAAAVKKVAKSMTTGCLSPATNGTRRMSVRSQLPALFA